MEQKNPKPRPFQLLFFFGGEGFQAIGRCFFFLRNPPRIPPPKIPHLPHWSAGLRPLGTLVKQGQLWHQCPQFPSQVVSLKNRSLYLPSRELTYHTFIHIPFKRYPLEDDFSSIGGTKCLTGSSLASHDKKTRGSLTFHHHTSLFKFKILTTVYHNPLIPPQKKNKPQGGQNPFFMGLARGPNPGHPTCTRAKVEYLNSSLARWSPRTTWRNVPMGRVGFRFVKFPGGEKGWKFRDLKRWWWSFPCTTNSTMKNGVLYRTYI